MEIAIAILKWINVVLLIAMVPFLAWSAREAWAFAKDTARGSEEPAFKDARCSFCFKARHQVRRVVAGPTVWICMECIGVSGDLIAKELARGRAHDSRQLSLWED